MAEETGTSGVSSTLCASIKGGIVSFFEYDTTKIVHIRNKKVGLINRIVQLGIIGYIIGYAIIYKKGYQETELVESATVTKLKGVVYTDPKIFNMSAGIGNRSWDVADYVIPPQENDAFFVMTNLIVTPGQVQSVCDEDPAMPDVICLNDTDCPKGVPVTNGNGVRTGKCVPSLRPGFNGTKVCQIHAWCPVETDNLPYPKKFVLDARNFTVLIKNNIEFQKFNVKRRNILDTINNKTYLQRCQFKPGDPFDQYCPIFKLDTILSLAGESFDDIAVLGGVVAINIYWDCNLDFDIKNCRPAYTFRRLDDKKANLAKGWNFRYANYYSENGEDTRTLIKAYGIRFVVKVTGQAGKFNIVPLATTVGSGIGLLALATVICDILVLYVLKKRTYYQDKKIQQVKDDDTFLDKLLDGSPHQVYQTTAPAQQNDESEGDVHKRSSGGRSDPQVGQYSRMDN